MKSHLQKKVLLSQPWNEEKVEEGKNIELNNWRRNQVYEEVLYTGQNCISTRWVITEKLVYGEKKIKARLVARDFEELKKTQTDSSIYSMEYLRSVLAVISSKPWKFNSTDIKSAFLLGHLIDREVYLIPAPEFERHGIVWKLKTCIHELSGVSRTWCFRVRDEFL